jgi:XTP/dITP diphosphohydrolase
MSSCRRRPSWPSSDCGVNEVRGPAIRHWVPDPGRPILVASANPGKIRELLTIWGSFRPPLQPAGPLYRPVEETGATYEENALLKARALAESAGVPALADDSGIEVEVLGWKPGVHSARTPSPNATDRERNAYLLRAAGGRPSRLRFVCVCALVVPGYEALLSRGEVEGRLAPEERGSNGFGYDPIFFYPPYGATLAEVPEDKKHAVSHRGRAVRALQAQLVGFDALREIGG